MENEQKILYNNLVDSHFVQNQLHIMAKKDKKAQKLGGIREDLEL